MEGQAGAAVKRRGSNGGNVEGLLLFGPPVGDGDAVWQGGGQVVFVRRAHHLGRCRANLLVDHPVHRVGVGNHQGPDGRSHPADDHRYHGGLHPGGKGIALGQRGGEGIDSHRVRVKGRGAVPGHARYGKGDAAAVLAGQCIRQGQDALAGQRPRVVTLPQHSVVQRLPGRHKLRQGGDVA